MSEINKYIQSTFSELSNRVGVDRLKDYARIESRDWNRLLNLGQIDILQADSIFARMGFSLENAFDKNVNLDAVCAKIQGEREWLPDRYGKCAYSKTITTNYVLSSINDLIKNNFYSRIIRYFQIPDVVINSESFFVSTALNADIFEYMAKRYDLKATDFIELGRCSLETLIGNNTFISHFESLNIRDAYEKLINVVSKVIETSNDYRIVKLTEDHLILRKSISDELLDNFGCVQSVSNQHQSFFAAGIFAQFPLVLDAPPCKVSITSSEFLGDDYCEFVLELPKKQYPKDSNLRLIQ